MILALKKQWETKKRGVRGRGRGGGRQYWRALHLLRSHLSRKRTRPSSPVVRKGRKKVSSALWKDPSTKLTDAATHLDKLTSSIKPLRSPNLIPLPIQPSLLIQTQCAHPFFFVGEDGLDHRG